MSTETLVTTGRMDEAESGSAVRLHPVVRNPIKINKALLDDPEIAEIFQHPIGVQIYLAIGSSHIRSQYFNGSILRVVRYLTKRKTVPKTVLELQLAFRRHGRGDMAACEPWSSQLEHEPPSDPNWNGRRDRNNKRIAERNAKFQELLDALNGVNPWQPEWIPNDKISHTAGRKE